MNTHIRKAEILRRQVIKSCKAGYKTAVKDFMDIHFNGRRVYTLKNGEFRMLYNYCKSLR